LPGEQFRGCRDDSGLFFPYFPLQGAEEEMERYPFEKHLADYNKINLAVAVKPSRTVLPECFHSLF